MEVSRPIIPARSASRRLPSSTCPQIEEAAPRIGDPEVVAWLQRHHAAATSRGPILRPYDRDAIAWFEDGLLHAPAGLPALILADGRAFEGDRGELGRQLASMDFEAVRCALPWPSGARLAYWAASAVIVAALVARAFIG